MSWKRRILFAATTLCVFCITAELVFRVVGYGSFVIYLPHESLLWVPKPNQVARTVENLERITINNLGLRYEDETNLSQPGNGMRILCFGDSVTMGWGVDDHSHFSAQLQKLLRGKGERWQESQVISAGVNAYPMSLCVRRFEMLVNEGAAIDKVVLTYSFNNGHEHLARIHGEEKQRFLRRVKTKSLLRRSAIYNVVIENWLRTTVYYRIRDRLVAGSWEYSDQDSPEAIERYINSLEKALEVSRRSDVELILLLLPSRNQRGELGSYQDAFATFARENGLRLANAMDRMASMDHDTLFMDHNHPTADGHRIIAGELFRVLVDEHLEGDGNHNFPISQRR